ncbi:MAG: alpha/beta hydrolase [Actinomycetota bacterium]
METISIPSSDGVTVALHHFGGRGRPLLIGHGTGFNGRAYRVLAGELHDHFDVWSIDFRGHGASNPPKDADYAWDRIADDFEACIDHIGTPMLVCGHSLGSVMSLVVAQRRPDAIERAWLYEPVVFPQPVLDARDENPMSAMTRRRRADFDSRDAALERYRGRPPFDRFDPRCLEDLVEFGFVDTETGVTLACIPEHEARVYEAEVAVTLERMAGTELDCTIAVGESDPVGIVSALAAPLADQLPNATLQRWPELSHLGPLEAPEEIAAAVIEALG